MTREQVYALVMRRYDVRRRAAKRAVDWWYKLGSGSVVAMLDDAGFQTKLAHSAARGNR